LADAPDLGSGSVRIEGSTPFARTIGKSQDRPSITVRLPGNPVVISSVFGLKYIT
jgi:hypothetical protein